MRESGIEYKVGLLIATSAVLFAGFIFLLGNCSLRGGYTVYVDYDFSGNVQEGAPVKVSGIKVGRVENVAFLGGEIDKATGRRVQVRVELWIENRAKNSVRQDAEFFINTAGVLGEQYVEIVPGDDWDQPPIAPGAIVVGVNPPRTDLVVARLYELLDIVSAVLREDRDKITGILRNGAGAVDEVNRILTENREHIGEMIVAVTDLAHGTKDTLDKVNRGLDPGAVAAILRDTDKLLVTADRSLDGLTPTAQAFLQDATRVTGLVTEPRIERALGAVDRAAGAAEQAEDLMLNANGLLKDLRAGKGTAGALLSRSEVYTDLRELIRDLRRHPWKVFWKE
ncbi:MAG: MCE family protein [Kofleriaceae bacterium]|nr:MCE family protein [Myxococcales bacterium]MCB9561291.1 MCE family protein [Kofleriaceae bacterium]